MLKVLLDGLYDPDSPISKLLGVHNEVMGEIIWQKMLARNWQIFPDPDNPANMSLVERCVCAMRWASRSQGNGFLSPNRPPRSREGDARYVAACCLERFGVAIRISPGSGSV